MPSVLVRLFMLCNAGGRKRGMKRGIPNVLMNEDNRARRIDARLLPSTAVAVQQYTANGGTISSPCSFGTDPLIDPNKKSIRDQAFYSRYSVKLIFCNGCDSSYKSALKFLIDTTYRLSHS